MNKLNIVIATFAAIGTVINAWALIKYSRVNISNTIQDFILKKSKDCNAIWLSNGGKSYAYNTNIENPGFEIFPLDVVMEINISIQLLDNIIQSFSIPKISKQRNFFLLQFWIQLDNSLREAIKGKIYWDGQVRGTHKSLDEKMQIVLDNFKQFFKSY